jgi:hypothetical protein
LTPQEQKLVEGAKKEGAVTILNPIFSDRTGQRLAEAFIRHYDLAFCTLQIEARIYWLCARS